MFGLNASLGTMPALWVYYERRTTNSSFQTQRGIEKESMGHRYYREIVRARPESKTRAWSPVRIRCCRWRCLTPSFTSRWRHRPALLSTAAGKDVRDYSSHQINRHVWSQLSRRRLDGVLPSPPVYCIRADSLRYPCLAPQSPRAYIRTAVYLSRWRIDTFRGVFINIRPSVKKSYQPAG